MRGTGVRTRSVIAVQAAVRFDKRFLRAQWRQLLRQGLFRRVFPCGTLCPIVQIPSWSAHQSDVRDGRNGETDKPRIVIQAAQPWYQKSH